ncbi:MAG: DUF72 domain-containing protein [Candidatus Longimicrobiales bacterium M2_2A_002]
MSTGTTSGGRGTIRIGVSGWEYDAWRGEFYPDELERGQELAYALRRFPTVEVNGTFYSLKKKSDVQRWLEAGTGDSVFAVKGSRYITHMKRLADPDRPLANFFGQGLMVLGDALGPVLWQLRDDFAYDPDRLVPFLEALPGSHDEAAALARRHDDRLEEAATEPRTTGPVRHALEPRHPSFESGEAKALLREHGVALVVSANPGRFPIFRERTADFMYVRLHGPEVMYEGSYPDGALDRWASRIEEWSGGGDVYVYFDNDADGAAPFDARRLMERLGLAGDRAAPGMKDAMPG